MPEKTGRGMVSGRSSGANVSKPSVPDSGNPSGNMGSGGTPKPPGGKSVPDSGKPKENS